jgi:hypothetical protein
VPLADDEDLAGMDCTEEQRPTLSASMAKYQCVICGQLTHSTAAEPMGVVVLLQVSIANASIKDFSSLG